jgi:hypothetical protein
MTTAAPTTADWRMNLSRYCWIALLGFMVTVPCAFLGVALASELIGGDDESAVYGLIWGTLAGVALGGFAVGLVIARSKSEIPGPAIRLLVCPGVFVGLPLFFAATLNRDVTSGLRQAGTLIALSGVALEFPVRAAHYRRTLVERRSRRTRVSGLLRQEESGSGDIRS